MKYQFLLLALLISLYAVSGLSLVKRQDDESCEDAVDDDQTKADYYSPVGNDDFRPPTYEYDYGEEENEDDDDDEEGGQMGLPHDNDEEPSDVQPENDDEEDDDDEEGGFFGIFNSLFGSDDDEEEPAEEPVEEEPVEEPEDEEDDDDEEEGQLGLPHDDETSENEEAEEEPEDEEEDDDDEEDGQLGLPHDDEEPEVEEPEEEEPEEEEPEDEEEDDDDEESGQFGKNIEKPEEDPFDYYHIADHDNDEIENNFIIEEPVIIIDHEDEVEEPRVLEPLEPSCDFFYKYAEYDYPDREDECIETTPVPVCRPKTTPVPNFGDDYDLDD